jgi:hypothetical protein
MSAAATPPCARGGCCATAMLTTAALSQSVISSLASSLAPSLKPQASSNTRSRGVLELGFCMRLFFKRNKRRAFTSDKSVHT